MSLRWSVCRNEIIKNDLISFKSHFDKDMVNETNDSGQTLLHLCCIYTAKVIADYLLDLGAETEIFNVHGYKPIDYIKHKEDDDYNANCIIDYFLVANKDITYTDNPLPDVVKEYRNTRMLVSIPIEFYTMVREVYK